MTIAPYVPFQVFKAETPVLNHSSRVYLFTPDDSIITIYDLSVSDGVLTLQIPYDLSVSDAVATDEMVPLISVSSSLITFDDTEIESESPVKSFVITNVGTAPLTITGITVSGDFMIEE